MGGLTSNPVCQIRECKEECGRLKSACEELLVNIKDGLPSDSPRSQRRRCDLEEWASTVFFANSGREKKKNKKETGLAALRRLCVARREPTAGCGEEEDFI